VGEDTEINLMELLQILLKRKWTIIIITLISVIIATMMSIFFTKPVYESRASVIIAKEGATFLYEDKYTYNDIIMYQNLVKTYSEIAKSNSVLKKTQEGIKAYSTKGISNLITVIPKANTQILDMKVKGDNPIIVANIAKELVKNFIIEAKRVLPAGNIEVLDEPEIPSGPISSNRNRKIAIAFFLGLMVSVGVSFLLEYTDQAVRTEEDIKRCLDIPILSSIPKQQFTRSGE
jgi:capsular polysaccharide biosynthesis protein